MSPKLSKCAVLVTVICMDLLAGMEFDLFVPSFPLLQEQFGLTPFWVEALLSVNFIGYCISLFLVGGLADRYGRKPIILTGLITFILGSVLCLVPTSYYFLFVGRFLQGMGVAAPAILSFLIIADAYPIKNQQFLLAMLNGSMNAATAAAPVIGSYVTLYFRWQGNFMALLLMGLATLILTLLCIPHTKPHHQETLLQQGYFDIIQNKPLMLLIVNIILMFVPYWIFVGMSPLLYMEDLGVSLSHFGFYQGALALVFAIGSVLFGLSMRKFDQKKMLFLSIQIFIFSVISIGLATFFDSRNPLLLTLAFLPFVIGQIIPTTINFPVCLNYLPQAKGRVSAIIQGSRLIIAALFLQVAGYFYEGSFQSIGIILTTFVILVASTLFIVVKNQELMKHVP